MTKTDINWPDALRSTNREAQTAAIGALREILIKGLHVALGGRKDVSDAHIEDFAQDGLLRILERLDQFQGRSQFTTWAQSIALNTAFAELRRKRWQDVSLDALIEQGGRLTEPSVLPDDALGEDRARLVAVLRRSIAEDLTPKQRAAILGELQEMPFDQIVALLGTTRSAAYKMLHDARRALKNRLLEAGISGADIQHAFSS